MSNVIQIKRGSAKPNDNILAEYELGYDTTKNRFYIGLLDSTITTKPIKARELGYIPCENSYNNSGGIARRIISSTVRFTGLSTFINTVNISSVDGKTGKFVFRGVEFFLAKGTGGQYLRLDTSTSVTSPQPTKFLGLIGGTQNSNGTWSGATLGNSNQPWEGAYIKTINSSSATQDLDLHIGNGLTVGGTTKLSSSLSVTGATTLSSSLSVGSTTTLNSLSVTNAAILSGQLILSKSVYGSELPNSGLTNGRLFFVEA